MPFTSGPHIVRALRRHLKILSSNNNNNNNNNTFLIKSISISSFWENFKAHMYVYAGLPLRIHFFLLILPLYSVEYITEWHFFVVVAFLQYFACPFFVWAGAGTVQRFCHGVRKRRYFSNQKGTRNATGTYDALTLIIPVANLSLNTPLELTECVILLFFICI